MVHKPRFGEKNTRSTFPGLKDCFAPEFEGRDLRARDGLTIPAGDSAFQGEVWGIGLLGVLSIVLGIVLLLNPLFIGVAVLPFVLGAFGLVGGIVVTVGAFLLRRGSDSGAGEARTA